VGCDTEPLCLGAGIGVTPPLVVILTRAPTCAALAAYSKGSCRQTSCKWGCGRACGGNQLDMPTEDAWQGVEANVDRDAPDARLAFAGGDARISDRFSVIDESGRNQLDMPTEDAWQGVEANVDRDAPDALALAGGDARISDNLSFLGDSGWRKSISESRSCSTGGGARYTPKQPMLRQSNQPWPATGNAGTCAIGCKC